MPLNDYQRETLTTQFAEVFLPRPLSLAIGPSVGRHEWVNMTARVQGALILAMGIEVGFFDDLIAGRYLSTLLPREGESLKLGLEAQPILAQRIEQLGAEGFVTANYRPRFPQTDATQIAFGSAFLPIMRAWQSPGRVPAFLARVMFDADFDSIDTDVEPDDRVGTDARLPRSPEVDTAIDAFTYLSSATDTLKTADEWESDLSRSDFAGWLKAELSFLYLIQVDTSRAEVKRRLTHLALHLAEISAREAGVLIHAHPVDREAQSKMLAELSLRETEWRAEAVNIVERFDAALTVLAVE